MWLYNYSSVHAVRLSNVRFASASAFSRRSGNSISNRAAAQRSKNVRSNFWTAFPTRIETNGRSWRGKRRRHRRGPVLLRELDAKHDPHARTNTHVHACRFNWHDARCTQHATWLTIDKEILSNEMRVNRWVFELLGSSMKPASFSTIFPGYFIGGFNPWRLLASLIKIVRAGDYTSNAAHIYNLFHDLCLFFVSRWK